MTAVIGITTGRGRNNFNQPIALLTEAYVQAVIRSGGAPALIPSAVASLDWRCIYKHLDGILFSGGGDIDVVRFAGEPHPRVGDVDPEWDELELALLHAAVSDHKPFLGICRGCQLVNVGLGGRLYTHLPAQLPEALDHDYPGDQHDVLVHSVQLETGTRSAGILGELLIMVNSHHHQGLERLGDGVRSAGRSPDGLVEAVELPDHPFGVAVQWHPEWLMDHKHARNLFRRFVEAAQGPGQH